MSGHSDDTNADIANKGGANGTDRPSVASPDASPGSAVPARKLPPAAVRALAEAAARRADIDNKTKNRPHEFPAREGPDPARYGDWEKKGIASDF
jgi:hypothetical protein